MLFQSEKVLDQTRVPELRILQDVADEVSKIFLLLLNVVRISLILEPATRLLKVGKSHSGINTAEMSPELRKVLQISLAGYIIGQHLQPVHHVVRGEELPLHNLMVRQGHRQVLVGNCPPLHCLKARYKLFKLLLEYRWTVQSNILSRINLF